MRCENKRSLNAQVLIIVQRREVENPNEEIVIAPVIPQIRCPFISIRATAFTFYEVGHNFSIYVDVNQKILKKKNFIVTGVFGFKLVAGFQELVQFCLKFP